MAKMCPVHKVVSERKISYCSECGKPLVELEKCDHCGAVVYPNDKFCEQCGRPLK